VGVEGGMAGGTDAADDDGGLEAAVCPELLVVRYEESLEW